MLITEYGSVETTKKPQVELLPDLVIKTESGMEALRDIRYVDIAIILIPLLYFVPAARDLIKPAITGIALYKIAKVLDKERKKVG